MLSHSSRSSIQSDLFLAILFAFYFFTIIFLLLPFSIFILQRIAFVFESPALSDTSMNQATQQAWQIVVFRKVPTHSTFFTQSEILHLEDVDQLLWAELFPLFVVVSILASVRYASYFRYNKMSAKIPLRIIPRKIGIFALIFCVLSLLVLLIFPTFFDAFHRFFFPQGNYEFPANSLLVQIFPFTFWILEFVALQAGVLLLFLLSWLHAEKNFDILASLKKILTRRQVTQVVNEDRL